MHNKKENEDMLEEVNRKRMKLSDEKTMKKHRPSTFTFSTMKSFLPAAEATAA